MYYSTYKLNKKNNFELNFKIVCLTIILALEFNLYVLALYLDARYQCLLNINTK